MEPQVRLNLAGRSNKVEKEENICPRKKKRALSHTLAVRLFHHLTSIPGSATGFLLNSFPILPVFSRGRPSEGGVFSSNIGSSWTSCDGQPPGTPSISTRPLSRISSFAAFARAALSGFLRGKFRSIVELKVPRMVSPTPYCIDRQSKRSQGNHPAIKTDLT